MLSVLPVKNISRVGERHEADLHQQSVTAHIPPDLVVFALEPCYVHESASPELLRFQRSAMHDTFGYGKRMPAER